MTDTFCAWAAGFFDGEGHIGIYTRRRSWGNVVHIMRAGVTQRDRPALDLLVAEFSGYVGLPSCDGDCHRWSVQARKAEVFLRAIQPYSIVKAEQITVALAFMDRRIAVGQGRAAASRAVLERNLVLDPLDAERLRDLKRATP